MNVYDMPMVMKDFSGVTHIYKYGNVETHLSSVLAKLCFIHGSDLRLGKNKSFIIVI